MGPGENIFKPLPYSLQNPNNGSPDLKMHLTHVNHSEALYETNFSSKSLRILLQGTCSVHL